MHAKLCPPETQVASPSVNILPPSISGPQLVRNSASDFSASLGLVSIASSFINFSPCLAAISPAGVAVDAAAVNIEPTGIYIVPFGVEVKPQGILVLPTVGLWLACTMSCLVQHAPS